MISRAARTHTRLEISLPNQNPLNAPGASAANTRTLYFGRHDWDDLKDIGNTGTSANAPEVELESLESYVDRRDPSRWSLLSAYTASSSAQAQPSVDVLA
jgi:hypothetical protein